MKSLLGGLSVAFDTTALALCLSVALMFAQFLTSRLETELLMSVDRRVESELVGRFVEPKEALPELDNEGVQRMLQAVVDSYENLVQNQAGLWQEALANAQHKWDLVAASAGDRLEVALTEGLSESIREHARTLAGMEHDQGTQLAQHWQQLQEILTENARVLREQQVELAHHGDLLLRRGDGHRVRPAAPVATARVGTEPSAATEVGESPRLYAPHENAPSEKAA